MIDGREVPDFRSYLLPRNDYVIDDNWHVAGLAGTGSKNIVLDNAFVPDHSQHVPLGLDPGTADARVGN